MAKSKYLYEFTVDKEVEKKIEEKKMEGDQEITVTRTEKVKEPIKYAVLKPTRKLYDMAEIFLAKTISYYIREGIMPITLVAKRFGNDGGVLTTEEQEYINDLSVRIDASQKKLVDLKLDEKGESAASGEERSKILVEMMQTQSEIDRVRNSYLSLYENTAEMKARKKTIEWWITQLSYKNLEKPEEYFSELSFEKRYEHYVDILDGDDAFEKRVANKFSFLIGTWFANANSAITEEDFKSADEHFEKNFEDE